jgi:hypothetical protein
MTFVLVNVQTRPKWLHVTIHKNGAMTLAHADVQIQLIRLTVRVQRSKCNKNLFSLVKSLTQITHFNRYFDNECRCRCEKAESCAANKEFKDSSCSCECKNPMPATIPENKRWNADTCSLECKDSSACPGTKARNPDTCECGCPKVKSCTSPQTFLQSTCDCGCSNSPPSPIPTGKKWNPNICNLECVTQKCTGKQIIDASTCACKCPASTPSCGMHVKC